MATLTTLVTQLVAKVEPFIGGLNKAEERFAKFQKGLVGKAGTALFSVTALDKGFDALGQAMKKTAEEGGGFFASLQETATTALTTLPIIGGLNQAFISLRDIVLGDAKALQELNDRLASVQTRLSLTGAEATRLKGTMAVLKSLEQQVAALGNTAEVAQLKAAGATDVAIRKAMELRAQIDAYNKAISNEAGRAALIRGLEEQAGLWGTTAREIDLYKASLLNASEADLEHINMLHDKLDAMKALQAAQEEMNRLMDEGRRVWEQTRTPLEAYNLRLEELRKLLEAGAIDEETFQRAVDQAREALERQTKVEDKVEEKKPAAVFQSPAAIEQRFAQSFRTPTATDPGVKLLKTAEHTLVNAKTQTAVQKQQLKELEDLNNAMGQFTVYGGLN